MVQLRNTSPSASGAARISRKLWPAASSGTSTSASGKSGRRRSSVSEDHTLQTSGTFQPAVIEDIQTKAATGLYRIRGWGTLRERRWATFDDLTFLPCSLTRIPLEGYREKCSTRTVLGTRFARKPIELDVPIMITGMSWGALSFNAKVALAKGDRKSV